MYVEVVLFCFDFLEIFEIVGLCVTFFFFFFVPKNPNFYSLCRGKRDKERTLWGLNIFLF